MLITEKYRELNKQMHAERPSYGISAGHYRDFVHGLLKMEGYASVLDYGCGKGVLKKLMPEAPIAEYDPAIEGKDGEPETADLVCCFDVLEHVEPPLLNAVLRHVQKLAKQKFVFSISTRPADKDLPDGRNAHLIVRDQAWWRLKLQTHFQILSWEVKGDSVYGESLPIRGPVLHAEALATRKRRPMPRELLMMCDAVRQNSRKYADATHRIETIERWEGNGDKPADMIMAINILEHCADLDEALKDMCLKARLSVLVAMPCPENEAIWRHFFERRLRIVDWMIETINGQKRLVMCGGPAVHVQGVRGVGAVEEDKRWEQVEWSTPRYKLRIPVRSAHGRTAILACYGPSLVDMVQAIKDEYAKGNADVISVSGSHDFLLSNGIVPKYHVECDPRLHKADNIDHAHPDVQYLIASTCHPGYFEKLSKNDADIRLWHIATQEHTHRLVDELGESSDHIISGGGSVGLRAMPLLYTLGYRDFAIFGMDSSFRVEPEQMSALIAALETGDPEAEKKALQDMADTSKQWAGKHAGKRQTLCSVQAGDRLYVASPILLTYATCFFEAIQKTRDCQYRVYGESLLAAMCALYQDHPQTQGLPARAA